MSTTLRPRAPHRPDRSARARTALTRVLTVVAILVAVGGLTYAALSERPTTVEDDVRTVAASLNCLACAGEDVANSTAPLAESMRLVIAEHLEQGRSPAEIRAWFVARYGPAVLLDPPRQDAGLIAWVAPLLVVAAAAGFAVYHRGRRRHRDATRRRAGLDAALVATAAVLAMAGSWALTSLLTGETSAGTPAASTGASVAGVLQDAVAQDPGNDRLRTALASRLETEERYPEAAEQYAALGRLRPLDASVHHREGFARFRADDLPGATAALEQALIADPDHAESLLLLGTIRYRAGDPRAEPLLRRFLDLAPDHPAAGPIRDRLEPSPDAAATPGGAS